MGSFYTPEHRALQDRFGTRRLADTQERAIVSERLSEADRTFIAERDMLFLSTIDATGQPTVSYKGGVPGFVRVDDDDLLLPCYDGNGMFLSMGNVMEAPRGPPLHRIRDTSAPARARGCSPGCLGGIRTLIVNLEADVLSQFSAKFFQKCLEMRAVMLESVTVRISNAKFAHMSLVLIGIGQ